MSLMSLLSLCFFVLSDGPGQTTGCCGGLMIKWEGARSRTQCCVCPSRIIARFQQFCEGKSTSSRCEERARPVSCAVFDICCQSGPMPTPLHPCVCSTTFETFWLCILTYSVPRRSILLTTSMLTSASLGPRSTRCLSSTPYPHNSLT